MFMKKSKGNLKRLTREMMKYEATRKAFCFSLSSRDSFTEWENAFGFAAVMTHDELFHLFPWP